MDFVAPEALIFWTTIFFVLFFFILAKFAWKPILGAVKQREETIENALLQADKARQEMADLKLSNENILKEARAERDAFLKDARTIKEKMIADAKIDASNQANNIIEQAKSLIENEKQTAIAEFRNRVAELSIDIAEKLLQEELSHKDKHLELIEKMMDNATKK